MQKKKVLLITYGNRDHASTRVRALNHFDRLNGFFDTTWIPRVTQNIKPGIFNKLTFAVSKRLRFLQLCYVALTFHFDIVFIQVMFFPGWFLKVLKRNNKKIYFDFDDAIYTYSQVEFDLMMKYADKVIVSTPYLADYIKPYHKTAAVIFSPVDTDLIKPNFKKTSPFTIGWIGSTWTLPYLQRVVPVLKELVKRIDFELLVVGAQISIEGVNVQCLPWSEKNELEALSKLDVGIMPLNNDEWSAMKGGYKLYLYMAAAKAMVASPYGINSSIVKEGFTGFLVETDSDWLDTLYKLYFDPLLRQNMGAAARVDAEEKYSYNVCTRQLLDFINS